MGLFTLGLFTFLRPRHESFTGRGVGFDHVTDTVGATCRAGRAAASGGSRDPWLFNWIPLQVFAFAEEVEAKTGLPVVQIQASPREIIFSTTGGYKIGRRLDRGVERLDLRPAWRGSEPRSHTL